jgi:hypothetical protein
VGVTGVHGHSKVHDMGMGKDSVSIAILSCDRPAMLRRVVARALELTPHVCVIDDASNFKPLTNVAFERMPERGGKRYFYRMMNAALRWHLMNRCEYQIVMPDDFLDLDFEAVQYYMNRFRSQYFALNLIRDDVPRGWTPINQMQATDLIFDTYIDCGFITNSKTMSCIGYHCWPVPDEWFDTPNKSSGVGNQLSKRFYSNAIPMYTPVKSLCTHGEHESKMHPEERRNNPIISK